MHPKVVDCFLRSAEIKNLDEGIAPTCWFHHTEEVMGDIEDSSTEAFLNLKICMMWMLMNVIEL